MPMHAVRENATNSEEKERKKEERGEEGGEEGDCTLEPSVRGLPSR